LFIGVDPKCSEKSLINRMLTTRVSFLNDAMFKYQRVLILFVPKFIDWKEKQVNKSVTKNFWNVTSQFDI
jgi:hypothetical protein